jgi:DNA-binding transcriptional regulator PaaX
MGEIEVEGRRQSRRNLLRHIILSSVQAAGLLTIMAVAPNVVGALHKLGIVKTNRQEESARRSFKKLLDQRCIELVDGRARLTRKGEMELFRLKGLATLVQKPKHWDRKWRVLIFDVPEYRRPIRDKIRRTLDSIGFARLQDSVWIYPYDCEDLIILLKADFKIGKDVLYLVVESLEGGASLRKRFGLR